MGNIDALRLEKLLKTDAEIKTFSVIDSTNSFLRREFAGSIRPALAAAEEQTAGRGRRGKSFYSRGGLYMSVLVPAEKSNPVFFTSAAAVAVCEALEKQNVYAGIKWVNDIILDGRKICGILCEQLNGGIIAGIGFNIGDTDFPEDIAVRAGSLDSGIDVTKLCADTADGIFEAAVNPSAYIEKYRQLDILRGKNITFEENGVTRSGTADGIDGFGGLVVKTESGQVTLSSGEITVRELMK